MNDIDNKDYRDYYKINKRNDDNKLKSIAKKIFLLKPSRMLTTGFIFIILIGAFLLRMDISLKSGMSLSFIDSLFISTSAVCVTGLTTKSIVGTFSTFGQAILLLLVQIGALGFMTFVCLVFRLVGKKLSLKERFLFEESFDFNTSNVMGLVLRIINFIIGSEIVGFLLLLFPFIRAFGVKGGIKNSIFMSISAFCSAGFDIFENTNLSMFRYDWYVNVVLMVLIILGTTGYLVIFDVFRKLIYTKKNNLSMRKLFGRFNLHTKIVLTTSGILIVLGAAVIFLFESFNPETIKGLAFSDKLVISLFQSVSARTGGLNTIDMAKCLDSTNLFYMILMFIGGSPASTAGGIKTVTIAILIVTAIAMIKNNDKTVMFKRTISSDTIRKAIVIFFIGITIVLLNAFAFLAVEDCSFMEGMFEVVSAFGTVGSSLGITKKITLIGKMILICLMFIGRVGIITVLMSMSSNKDSNVACHVEYPEEKIIMG